MALVRLAVTRLHCTAACRTACACVCVALGSFHSAAFPHYTFMFLQHIFFLFFFARFQPVLSHFVPSVNFMPAEFTLVFLYTFDPAGTKSSGEAYQYDVWHMWNFISFFFSFTPAAVKPIHVECKILAYSWIGLIRSCGMDVRFRLWVRLHVKHELLLSINFRFGILRKIWDNRMMRSV